MIDTLGLMFDSVITVGFRLVFIIELKSGQEV